MASQNKALLKLYIKICHSSGETTGCNNMQLLIQQADAKVIFL